MKPKQCSKHNRDLLVTVCILPRRRFEHIDALLTNERNQPFIINHMLCLGHHDTPCTFKDLVRRQGNIGWFERNTPCLMIVFPNPDCVYRKEKRVF